MAGKRPITTLLIGIGGSGGWTAVNVKRQLYDAYENRMPDNVKIIVLDTAQNPIFKIGADGKVREEGMGIGQTILERSEIAHVGGEVHELVRDIARSDKYPHIKSWFQANWFLENLKDDMFNLDRGAGMFRQFGRFAIFRDVQAPGTSAVSEMLNNTLVSLAQKMTKDDPALNVIICGSLAGGTGAGMFLDIPHLTQRVAAINGITASVRGFFYLPEAFKVDLGNKRNAAHGRAFGALRELSRFLLNSNHETGYPMHYHAPRAGFNQDLWQSSNRGKLYDFVYMIDGTGFNDRSLPESTAVAVADGIVNFIDPNYGPQQEQYANNINAQILDRVGLVGKQAYVSSLGSYSIIMPIQQIMENWSYRLVRDFMDDLVPGETDENGRLLKLFSNANPAQGAEKPKAELQNITKSMNSVPDLDNRDLTLLPVPLWRNAFDSYDKGENDETLVRRMRENDHVDWLEMLIPEAENDDEVATLRNSTIEVLQQRLEDFTDTSDMIDGGDPEDDYLSIKSTAERFISSQLGQSVSGGGRQGGQYAEKLSNWTDFNIRRFRRYMTSYIQLAINGTNRSNIRDSRKGKLGWLLALYAEMKKMFARFADVLNVLRTGANLINVDNVRLEMQEMVQDAESQMKEDAPNFGFPGFRGSSAAVKAQQNYIAAIQEYVDFYRMEFTRDAIAKTCEEIINFIDEIIAEFRHWRDLIATNNKSIYTNLVEGQKYIEYDLAVVSDIKNHRVIRDMRWENEHYDRYVDDEVRNALYNNWQWGANLVQQGRNESFRLGARVRGVHEDSQKNRLRRMDTVNWDAYNTDLLLEYARRIFQGAIQQESLVEYLRGKETARAVADELHNGAGYMISLSGTSAGQAISPGYILLAAQNGDEDRTFMSEINTSLGSLNQKGNISGQGNSNQIVEQCADAFRMTYIATAELVALESMKAYSDGKDKYESIPFDTRQKNHIFPAEVNAVPYEEKLKSQDYFNQPDARLLSDRVRLLLENEDLFTEFMFHMIYNIVGKLEEDTGTTVSEYYVMRAPFESGRDGFDVWELTAHEDQPSLLDAAVSFVISQHDYRNENRKIPIEYLHAYLETVMEHDTANRLHSGDLAAYNNDLYDILLAFSPPEDENEPWSQRDDADYVDIAKLIARYDTVYELLWEYEGTTDEYPKSKLDLLKASATATRSSAKDGKSHDFAQKQRELYDFYSIAIIRLKDELQKYKQQIVRRYERKFNRKF